MGALMEYKGDDVDQAINNACSALGVTREGLEIQVVTTGSAGFFGLGRRKAVVRVELREEGGGQKRVASADPAKEGRPGSAPRVKAAAETPKAPGSGAGSEAVVAEPLLPLSAGEQAQALATVTRLLELTGSAVRAGVVAEQADGKLRINLLGEESELLVGAEGQTLDALQYLLRKMLTKQLGRRVILELDAGDYRARRHRELEERALALAAEVKSSGKSRTMAAIGPAERRIVHLALQGDSEIRSRSVGDGLFKKVLLHPPGKGRRRPSRPRGKGRS